MILNMNVKVMVALNRSLKLLPVQVDLKSDLDLKIKNHKNSTFKKKSLKKVLKIFSSNKTHYKALSFQYIM